MAEITDISKLKNSININSYIPGVCNIGPEEIKKRKMIFYYSTIFSLILIGVVLFFDFIRFYRLLLFIPFISVMVNYLQIKNKFCVNFGFRSIYNFENIGKLQNVTESDARKKDKLKVRKMMVQALLVSFIFTLLVYLIP